MSLQDADLRAGLGVPEPHGAVGGRGEHGAPVGAECDASHPAVMGLESHDLLDALAAVEQRDLGLARIRSTRVPALIRQRLHGEQHAGAGVAFARALTGEVGEQP